MLAKHISYLRDLPARPAPQQQSAHAAISIKQLRPDGLLAQRRPFAAQFSNICFSACHLPALNKCTADVSSCGRQRLGKGRSGGLQTTEAGLWQLLLGGSAWPLCSEHELGFQAPVHLYSCSVLQILAAAEGQGAGCRRRGSLTQKHVARVFSEDLSLTCAIKREDTLICSSFAPRTI